MQEAMTYYLRTAVSRTGFGAAPTPRTGQRRQPVRFSLSLQRQRRQRLRFRDGGESAHRAPACAAPSARRNWRRTATGVQVRQAIEAWTRSQTKRDAMAALAEEGVCASQVFETHDLFTDPHLLERGFVHEVHHAEHGDVRLLGWPARMSKSAVPIRAAPLLGEHTDQVLVEDLGLGQEAIDGLRERGAIGSEGAAQP